MKQKVGQGLGIGGLIFKACPNHICVHVWFLFTSGWDRSRAQEGQNSFHPPEDLWLQLLDSHSSDEHHVLVYWLIDCFCCCLFLLLFVCLFVCSLFFFFKLLHLTCMVTIGFPFLSCKIYGIPLFSGKQHYRGHLAKAEEAQRTDYFQFLWGRMEGLTQELMLQSCIVAIKGGCDTCKRTVSY